MSQPDTMNRRARSVAPFQATPVPPTTPRGGRRRPVTGVAVALLAATLLLAGGCTIMPPPGDPATLAAAGPSVTLRGVDASALPEALQGGAVFTDRGQPEDPMHLYLRAGVNTVRLRLWFTPGDGRYALLPTLALAKVAARYHLALLLDIHYSDTWADPAHQEKPRAWQDMNGLVLQNAVREYTRDTIKAFNLQGTPPAYVQIGNEIGHGFLWDDGRVEPGRDSNWIGLAELLKAAVAGVRESGAASMAGLNSGTGHGSMYPPPPPPPTPRVILHIENGADNTFCREFFDRALLFNVPYDIIGLSYYPWWHGSLENLQWNLNDMATRYDKPVLLCETAYPWTLQWADDTHNIVGREDQLLPTFPANPRGQADYLRRLREILAEVPDGRGLGLVYWGADDVSAPGHGSAWENLALFGPEGQALPALRALGAGWEARRPTGEY